MRGGDRPGEDLPPARSPSPRTARRPALHRPPDARRTATRASRSYSVASAPDDSPELEFTVERLEGGRGLDLPPRRAWCPATSSRCGEPIGGWFVWTGDTPALLVGGGSGVVPLMAMLRLARLRKETDLVRLVVSVRSPGRPLLRRRAAVARGHRRLQPPGPGGLGSAGRAARPRRPGPALLPGRDGLRLRFVGVLGRRLRPPRSSSACPPNGSGWSGSGRPGEPVPASDPSPAPVGPVVDLAACDETGGHETGYAGEPGGGGHRRRSRHRGGHRRPARRPGPRRLR